MAYRTKAEKLAKLADGIASAQAFEASTGISAGTTIPGKRKLEAVKAAKAKTTVSQVLDGDQSLESEIARRKDRMRRIRQSDIRASIDAQVLRERLSDHSLGRVAMTVTQVRAATYLLDKVVSNAPLEITGEDGGSIGGLAEALEAARARVARAKLGSA